MNLQQLRSVRETVRRGFNLTSVAEPLHTSQPGVAICSRRSRGAYQRAYVYDFIQTFASPLTRQVVEQALVDHQAGAFDI